MKIASFFMVAEIEGEITAFIIVLGPEQSYESENYRFFSETFESFDYVDRIVVGDKFQGKGIGKTLYKYLINNSGEQRITCEVNLKPPNPGSILFHEKMGFKEVGQQFSEGGKKWVSLMCRVKETL